MAWAGESVTSSVLRKPSAFLPVPTDKLPPDGRDLNYEKFFDQGEPQISVAEDYNSHNTTRLDVAGMTQLMLKLEGMQLIARGELATVEEC